MVICIHRRIQDGKALNHPTVYFNRNWKMTKFRTCIYTKEVGASCLCLCGNGIDSDTDSPKPAPPQVLPKSILASVENSCNIIHSNTDKEVHILGTINVSKSILLIFFLPVLVRSRQVWSNYTVQTIQCPPAG